MLIEIYRLIIGGRPVAEVTFVIIGGTPFIVDFVDLMGDHGNQMNVCKVTGRPCPLADAAGNCISAGFTAEPLSTTGPRPRV